MNRRRDTHETRDRYLSFLTRILKVLSIVIRDRNQKPKDISFPQMSNFVEFLIKNLNLYIQFPSFSTNVMMLLSRLLLILRRYW